MSLENVLKPIVEITEPIVQMGCRLIEALLGEPCKIAGTMLADQIYAWQWSNRVRIAARAGEIMKSERIAERVLPPGFLLPLLAAAGNVDEPVLQEMWANLLASGVAAERHRHPGFIRSLEQLSKLDAKIIEQLKCAMESRSSVLSIAALGATVNESPELVSFSVENLKQLGICEDATTPPFPSPLPGNPSNIVCLTPYGDGLVHACRSRKDP